MMKRQDTRLPGSLGRLWSSQRMSLRGHLGMLMVMTLLAAALSGCSSGSDETTAQTIAPSAAAKQTSEKPPLNYDVSFPPMGKSDGVYYEIFVRSFNDSNGDGIGDLQGVIQKLNYLQELGIKGIWLMPINPSPSYHGYDVTDYYGVNPQYGTMDDMHKLTEEAHKRGIKVIIDLVANHTSSKHPWFIQSASDQKNKYRSWYTWAEDTGKTMPADGATGSNPWHELNGSHYLGIFWEGMPDLNYDNPDVRKEMTAIGQFWLKQGVDGFRLDAAKHIYEDFKSVAGKPETVKKNQSWWQEFRSGLDLVNKDAYVVGEIWDSSAVVGPFLDHALNSGFNFDLSRFLLGSARSERASTIAGTLNRMYTYYSKQSQGKFVDAPFLTNHDMNRVMSELQGNVDHAKMAASLLLTMPGNPFVYYGEEIGMKGVKPDERLREPMSWSESGKEKGETSWEASPDKEKGVSVEAEQKDPDSLLNHYKKMIALRNREPVLGDGGILPFTVKNDGVLGFVRLNDQTKVLIIHNLSGKPQTIDLNENGKVPFEKVSFSSSNGVKLSDGQLELPAYTTVLLK